MRAVLVFNSLARLLAVAVLCSLPSLVLADAGLGLRAFGEGRFGEAHRDWLDAARTGDAAAALYLGVQYDVGQGVAPDPGQALRWYLEASRLGSSAATFNAAVFYDSGRGIPRDPEAAVRFYEQAAGSGFVRAEFNLGLIYEAGDGVPRDPAAARRWFTRAYGHGIAAALPHLVRLGARPAAAAIAVPFAARPDRSMEAFEQAQSILLNRNQAELGRAVELFRASAEANNPLAAYDLAYCYEHAIGTSRDLSQAYRWYRRAAAKAGDEELKGLAGRNAELVAARLPASTRALLAQAGY